ncbi:DNA methylase N-4/N-6 [Pontibacillus chungwhensis BH030062]|uniref:DNA methylase N-4/N-6 n=1 Tax=Pontibacillus chungwhensis BH030062 TaxID=1385513 RepID=A0A0A2UMY6_9BACI|nr:DNA methyltransferase [Pontibacillus chungwhensis]KGP89657.1 DNA methylase N-4/N-6 [Pontibacillus chungwhensis BH030062]
MKDILKLYTKALPSKRSGSLYTAFSYPTKISPEAIAVYIASHTNPGETVLDTFGGSGTTGLATHLCDKPTQEVKELAEKMEAPVKWGPRKAYLYEISTIGSFLSKTMCNPPNSTLFKKEAENLLQRVEEKYGWYYKAIDPNGNLGEIRHIVWSETLKCNNCANEVTYWDMCVVYDDYVSLNNRFICPKCAHEDDVSKIERSYERYYDNLLGEYKYRKKREPKKVYGVTGKSRWSREITKEDIELLERIKGQNIQGLEIPVQKIEWGDLYRSGYHYGVTHVHHFYSYRNLIMLAALFKEIKNSPAEVREALRLLVLSYNYSHSTLMTRAVVKKNQKDLVLTSAQPGVLYISNLPIEKNILKGLHRKIKNFTDSFQIIEGSESEVEVINESSTNMEYISTGVIDYVFTDPPFGDYIPYSEINMINEVWLGDLTNNEDEAIISVSQGKGLGHYENMISSVFKELYRVLKNDGKATVVFHSANSGVWRALQNSYRNAGFKVSVSNVLDKLQKSFKQQNSRISVSGDPITLLQKRNDEETSQLSFHFSEADIIKYIINQLKNREEKITPERVYSRFINIYLENDWTIMMSAEEFYSKLITKYREEINYENAGQ